jgi:zinc transport system permease protein
VSTLIDALQFDFMRNALWAGVLVSVVCGVIGTFVVVKRLVFISGGISHAAFGGLGMFYFLGLSPVLGGTLVAVAASALLGLTSSERNRSQDATIGVLWAVGMAIGILFIAKTPGFAPNLMTYLFGNILAVDPLDVTMLLALDAVVLVVIGLFFKEFVAIAFDETFARVQGVAVRPLLTLFMVLVGLSVVMLIQVVGIVLVIALLTIPPLIALSLLRDFLPVMLASALIGVLVSVGGLALSFLLDLPSGPAIILLGAALLGLVRLFNRLRGVA